MNNNISRCLMLFVLLLVAGLYYPALDSRFLLDDYYNLGGLEQIGLDGYTNFLLSGFAGPSGRPLSLISFALQREHWPYNPFPFKLVNLLIHLLCGYLLYLISSRLLTHLHLDNKQVEIIALLTTALWLLHPLQQSTVLYVIQRMTQLSTLFTLLGMLGYIHAREHHYAHHPTRAGLLTMTVAVTMGIVFGVLSKENGILLPLYILVIEATFFSRLSRPGAWRIWAWLFLILPLVLLAIYLAQHLGEVLGRYQYRPFTMSERLLTEPRVLWDYLYKLFIPRPADFGLYHDDYPFSSGLLSPPSTIMAIVSLGILFIAGVLLRKRWPVFSFAVLWFFAGHALESTYLCLEIYFEHRNYLAVFGFILLITWALITCWYRLGNKLLAGLMLGSFYAGVLTVSILEIDLWSKPFEQVVEWQRRHPGSPRAMEDLGTLYLMHQEYDKALETYFRISDIYPHEIYPFIKMIAIKSCIQGEALSSVDWSTIMDRARRAKRYGFATLGELDALALNISRNKCKAVNKYNLLRVMITLAQNPEYEKDQANLHELAASLAMTVGDAQAMLANIDRALELFPTASRHMLKIKLLMAMDRREEAAQTLEVFKKFLNRKPMTLIIYRNIIKDLEGELPPPGRQAG